VAMALTMVTAIFGGGVDTGVIPSGFHAMLAVLAIVANFLALRAIVDANVTTFMVGIILYQFGSGPIRGFALTLCIGIVCSLFTAIVITRAVFDFVTSRWTVRQLSI